MMEKSCGNDWYNRNGIKAAQATVYTWYGMVTLQKWDRNKRSQRNGTEEQFLLLQIFQHSRNGS